MPHLETDQTKPPAEGEKSGAQLGMVAGAVDGTFFSGLNPANKLDYRMARKIMSHPSLALAHAIASAPILASSWSFEAKDDAPQGAKELIESIFKPIRHKLLFDALRGGLWHGWQPWEKIWEFGDVNGSDVWTIRKLKPLLHDISKIQIDLKTGQLVGVKQKGNVEIPIEQLLLYSHDQEGDNYYGVPRLRGHLIDVYRDWLEANTAAKKYDKKLASPWVEIHYPPGEGTMKDGSKKENWKVARELAEAMFAGRIVYIPNEFASETTVMEKDRGEKRKWLIDVKGAQAAGKQASFVPRLQYLDKQLFRGYLVPERTATEGEHGTKAEAETHGDVALTISELEHGEIVRFVNWHAVDQVLALNYGEQARGTVWIKPTKLVDRKRNLIRSLINTLMQSPEGRERMLVWLDWDAIIDAEELPKVGPIEVDDPDENPPPTPPPDMTEDLSAALREMSANSQ